MLFLLLFFAFLCSAASEDCSNCTWSLWGTCTHRCGGGIQKRTRLNQNNSISKIVQVQNRTCNAICENNGLFEGMCVCNAGFRGKCCQLDCDDGYFGDGCNSTCNCPTDAICDKETGACLLEILSPGHSISKEETSTRLYVIIGSGIGVFFILQILIVILIVSYKGRKRRKAEMDDRLDKEKFWSGKTTLDGPENHYEEIPFDKKGETTAK
ncbi:unnamed protein product [Mytilus coruscus]|uniref:EGF-like domain-containing protein n=1 Tax=Mytilus coruscus TaxID=42192 RepID=A0A6J8B158_MYTCO|nr:unnamed protein product [Mytilus coruscus]